MAIKTTGVRYDVIARDSASKVFDKIGKQAGKTDSTLGKVAKSAAKYGAVMGGAVAGGLVFAADKAVDFERVLTRVETQAGGTSRDVGILDKGILKLGKSAEQGPDKLADSMVHLKSVGLGNTAALKDLKVASDLAAVGGSDLEATANALAGAWRSGIKGAESFSKAAATTNAIIGAGNMTMSDFVEAIGTGILPSAKSFGLSLKSVGSALALMTDEGIPAADAATRLRMTISLLGAPSDKAEKQLRKIGLTSTDLAKQMRSPAGLVGAVGLLKTRLDASGMSAVQQSQLISKAFGGGRSSSGILTLLNNYDTLVKKQDQITKSMGKFPAAVATQRKTVAAQIGIIKSNLDVFAIEVGDKLLPPVSRFAVYLNETAIPAAGRFSSGLAHLVPVGRIEGDFKAVTGFVGGFFSALSPKKAPKLVVPALAVPETKIPATLKAPTSQAQQLGSQLRAAFSGGLDDAVSGLDWGKLGGRVGAGLDSAFGWVAKHTGGFGKKIGAAIGAIDWVNAGKTVGNQAVPFVVGFLDNMFTPLFSGTFWRKHWWDAIIAVVSVIPFDEIFPIVSKGFGKIPWGKLGDLIGDGLEKIQWGKSLDWAKWIGSTAGDLWASTSRLSSRFASDFTDLFSRQFPRLGAWISREFSLIPTRLGVMGIELRSALDKGITSLVDSVPGMGNRFVRAIFKYFGRYSLYQAGTQLIAGLYGGIVGRLGDTGHWIKVHMVAPLVGSVRSLFGIHSPSTVFATIGGQLISGLYGGVIGALGSVGHWAAVHIKAPLVGAVVKPSAWLYGKGAAVIGGFWDGLKAPWHDVQSWVSGVSKWIKDHKGPISLDRKLLVPAGKALMHGLLEGLKVGFKGVGNFVHKTGTTVAETVSDITSKIGMDLTGGGAAATSGANQALGKRMMLAAGFQPAQWVYLKQLWNQESGWRTNATNPSSGAYGIAQALPAGKYASAGADWRTNPATQIAWGLSYIKQRYGTPGFALAHERSFNWYAKGGLAPIGQTAWVGERGPELMQVTPKGTRIYNNADSMAMARLSGMPVPGYASGTVAAAQARVDAARDALERARERRTGTRAAETRLRAAQQELANARRAGRASVSNALANGWLKSVETGTASAIASAVKSMNTKLQSAGAGSLVAGNLRTASKLESLATQRSGIVSKIAAAKGYATDQASSLGDYLSVSGTSATSMQGLLSQLQTGQSTAKHFASEVTRLRKLGLSTTMLGQLAEAGPGSQLATVLGGASSYDVKQLNTLAASQTKLTKSFGNSMADAMYDSGKNAGKGFLTGLEGQEKALQAEMDRLAAGMVKTIKHRLDIRSPSRVMRDQVGKQVAYGAALGVRMHTPQGVGATQRMADLMGAVQARTGAAGAGRTAARAPVVHVHVHVQDQALADLIDVRVKDGVEVGHADLMAAAMNTGG